MRLPKCTLGKHLHKSAHLCCVHRRGQQSKCLRFGQSSKHCSATKSPMTAFVTASWRFRQREHICHTLKDATFGTPETSTMCRDFEHLNLWRTSTKVSTSKLGQFSRRKVCNFGSSCTKYPWVKAPDSTDKERRLTILVRIPCGSDTTWGCWTDPVCFSDMCSTFGANGIIARNVAFVKDQLLCMVTHFQICLSSMNLRKYTCALPRLNIDLGSRCVHTAMITSPGIARSWKEAQSIGTNVNKKASFCVNLFAQFKFTQLCVSHLVKFFMRCTHHLTTTIKHRIETKARLASLGV